MRGILNRVRKCDQLLVVIEGARPRMLNHLRAQCGVSRTQQDQPVTRTTRGARAVMPVVGHVPALAVAYPRGSKHAHQLFIAAGITDFAIALHVAAATAQELRHTLHR